MTIPDSNSNPVVDIIMTDTYGHRTYHCFDSTNIEVWGIRQGGLVDS